MCDLLLADEQLLVDSEEARQRRHQGAQPPLPRYLDQHVPLVLPAGQLGLKAGLV